MACRPAFDLVAEQCRATSPAVAEEITGVPAAEIERAAQVLWDHRPVAFYTWSGLEQHSGTTQIIRAINVLYALTGCFDAPGGNVLFTPVPTNPIAGMELLDRAQRAKAIGVSDRPLGPARFGFVTGEDFYTAALEGRPYRPRGLVSFGSNLLMAHGDSARGRDALQTLDFHVHLDLFMSPTAEQADIVLPVTGAFEAEGLKVGFEISQEAQSLVQLRAPLVPPVGEARSDIEIIFDLATRLGLGEHFFDGNVDAGWAHQLAPSGVTLAAAPRRPRGCPPAARDPPPEVRGGRRRRRAGRVRHAHGTDRAVRGRLPRRRPATGPDLHRAGVEPPITSRPGRGVPARAHLHQGAALLRDPTPPGRQPAPPRPRSADGAAPGHGHRARHRRRGLGGDQDAQGQPSGPEPRSTTPSPRTSSSGQHGWFEPCEELDLPGFPPFGPGSANLNLVLSQTPSDPISGSSPLRAQVCDVTRLTDSQTVRSAATSH